MRINVLLPYLLSICFASGVALAQSGPPVPELAALDRNMEAFAQRWRLPGASLAVTYQGRLVYSRGFGFADRQSNLPVQPETLFRIASLSKPYTAVTLLKLQEEGRLDLDDKVFDILGELRPLLGDPRMTQITVRQLLQHTAGWDPEQTGDPMFADYATLRELDAPMPPDLGLILTYVLSQPLQFTPGSRYVYSNFGYALAGRVIEAVTGMPYADAVRKVVLEPLGITRMRIGRSFANQAAPLEARYYSLRGETFLSVFSAEPVRVPEAYGSFVLENLDAHGGWLASPTDLVRFLSAVDGSGRSFLKRESWQELVARNQVSGQGDLYYGLGFQVARQGNGFAILHNGALSGSSYSFFASSNDGWTFAFVTNQGPDLNRFDEYEGELLQSVAGILSNVRAWPGSDIYPSFYREPAPFFTNDSVISAASPVPGLVVPGAPFVIYGVKLGPRQGTQGRSEGGMLRTELEGVRAFLDGLAVPILYASEGQVNVQVPLSVAAKQNVALTVERDGAWSQPVLLPVAGEP